MPGTGRTINLGKVKGEDAKINGFNTLNVTQGTGVSITQNGSNMSIAVDADTAPTASSQKPITSGGVAAALGDISLAGLGAGTAAVKNAPASGNAASDEVVLGNDSRLSDSRNAADVYAWAKAETKPTYTASEVGAIAATEKGANGGVATLDGSGKLTSSQLPTLGTAAAKDVPSSGDASATQVVMGNDSRLTDARNAADVSAWAKASTKPSYNASEVGAIPASDKGSAGGVAELDSTGKVPASQLPSYVDDVIEGYYKTADGKFYNEDTYQTEITPESDKVYISKDTNVTYRWTGSAYAVIGSDLALGETSSTAYRGDRGKTAYDHSQSAHARVDATKTEASSTNGNIKINGTETTVYTHPGSGTNPHGTTKADVGLGNVGNFKAVSTEASQGLSETEKANARSNIGAGDSSFSGSYSDLSNKPTLGTAAAKDVAASGNASTTQVVMGNDSRLTDSRNAKDVSAWAKAASKPTYTASEVGAIAATEKGANGGVATLDSTGKLPSSQLPTLGTAAAKDVPSSGNASATQVVMGNDSRLTDARNAADVYSWAKAETKPTYTASEVGLGNVGNFKAVSTVASQGLSATEKTNARANIGAGTSSFSGSYSDLSNKPTLGTAAAKDVPSSGNASATQVVMGNDSRLTDARNAADVSAWAKASSKPSYNYSEIGNTPTLGTAAAKDVPASGDASTTQVVMGNDSRLTDARTPASHTHGNIQNTGALQTTDVTIASGDKLVVTDASNSNKVARASVSFDGSTATKCLTQKGTWESFSNNAGTVTSVKVGSTSYNPSSGVVSLPAYPTTLPASDTVSTYSSTGTAPVNGKAVAEALTTLPSPMVFKGSLGTGGTITALPVNGTANIGDTYKVITAGTYASQAAKVGDMFICDTKTSSANTWVYIPSADEPSGTVTSVTIKATAPITINSSSAITTSGSRTISHADSGATAGSYGDSAAQTPDYGASFKVPYVTVNATGHVTGISAHNVTLPASTFGKIPVNPSDTTGLNIWIETD